MKSLVTFGGLPPLVVSTLRGAIEAGLLASIGYLITFAQGVDFKDFVAFAPIVFAFLRQSEGVIDELVDPAQNRTGIPAGRVAKYIKGLEGVSGSIVGFFRATIEVAVLAGIGYALNIASDGASWGDYMVFSPAAVWGLRTLEGFADQFIDPSQNRAGQP